MGSVADLFSSIGKVAGRAAPALNLLGSDRDNFTQNMQAFDRSYAEMDAQDQKEALAEALANTDDLTYATLAEAIMPYAPMKGAEFQLKGQDLERQRADQAATIANVMAVAKANGVQMPDGFDPAGGMDINSLRTLIDAGAKRKTNELDAAATRETNRLRAEAEAKAKQSYWDNYGKYVGGGKKDDFNLNKFKAEQSYYDALSAYQLQKRNYDKAKDEMLDKIAKASNDEAQQLRMEFSLFREPVPPHKPSFIKAVGKEPAVADVVSQPEGPAPQANKPAPASAPALPPRGNGVQSVQPERSVAEVIESPTALPSKEELYAATMGLPSPPDVNVGGVDIPNPFSSFSKSIQAQKIANLATYLLKEGQATDKRDAAMKAAAMLESRK